MTSRAPKMTLLNERQAESIGVLTRRGFTLLGGSAALAGSIRTQGLWATSISGVEVGTISYSFRALPRPASGDHIDALVEHFRAAGLDLAEITGNDIEPLPSVPRGGRVPIPTTREYYEIRERVRQWRLETSLGRYEEIGAKFRAAGIRLMSFAITISDDFFDEEIDKTMLAAKALGVEVIGTNQMRMPMAEYAVPFAAKHGIALSFHNHADAHDPNEIGSVASFERVFALSDRYKANLDVGHFVAGNNDPVAFIERYHDRITHLHLKDREVNGGPNRVWGEGDTPLVETLRLIRDERYDIPCIIEYEYPGAGSPIEEVQRCVQFIRNALA
jgi:sugar phosphate isomerase/epimerase